MKKNKNIIILIIVFASLTLGACSNMHMGTSMGVDVNFGSNGPKINPHMSVGMNSGGYYR